LKSAVCDEKPVILRKNRARAKRRAPVDRSNRRMRLPAAPTARFAL